MTERGIQAVEALAHLFKLERDGGRPIFLLGAGASYRSGIPLAADTVQHIAKWAYIRQKLQSDPAVANPRPSDWLPFLHQQEWFDREPGKLADNFPRAVRNLLRPREARREFFLEMLRAHTISDGYRAIAQLDLRGLITTTLTTNFDRLCAEALDDLGPSIRNIVEVNRVAGDIAQFEVPRRNQIVYLHGAVEFYTDRMLDDELQGLDPGLVNAITPLAVASPIIVVGYRGAEQSIISLLQHFARESYNFRHGLYWCRLPGEPLHSNVASLAGQIGTNFQEIEIEGFDDLLTGLNDALKGDDAFSRSAPNYASPKQRSVDEEPMPQLTLADLDQALAVSVLVEYSRRLGRGPVNHDNYEHLLAELGLIVSDNGIVRPTFGCYMLFGTDVEEYAPQASIAVTERGKKRHVIRGNLFKQHNELLTYLDSDFVNPLLRLKGSRSSSDERAYPRRALSELIINLLVHRDYAAQTYSTIDILPGTSIEFSNAGGLIDSLKRQVRPKSDGAFEPIRDAKAIRNPAIADVLFGFGTMDKAGTGLVDTLRWMRESGGDARFSISATNDRFEAVLLQASQPSPTKSVVATALSPIGVYSTNLLLLTVRPNLVWSANVPNREDLETGLFYKDENPATLPVFISSAGRLYSFADLRKHTDFLSRRRIEHVEDHESATFLLDSDNKRLYSWLLRKHWEIYLARFRAQGLYIATRDRRAYFRNTDGDRNVITYDSSMRRGVKRSVVKRRGTESSIWFEHEGVAYAVVHYGESWAVQIKPFYMFTGRDGKTPLPGFIRTSRSTRRIKFDRNKSVDDDLTFWARFLSSGAGAIPIGGDFVKDLVLSATYEQIDVKSTERINAFHD